MSELHFLPAQYGDAFFLHCQKGDEEGWIVVDGGTSSNAKLNPFIKLIETLPSRDLMILTHHDDDHLAGIRAYIKKHKTDNPFPVKCLWVNCARHFDFPEGGDLSAPHANKLADILSNIQKEQPLQWKDYIMEGCHDDTIKFADIDILNPSRDMLERFIPRYEKEAGIPKTPQGSNLDAQRSNDDYDISLEDLAKRCKDKPSEKNYHQLVNMVSIAFIVHCDGLSGLMLGDSFPDQIIEALQRLGYSRENKLIVDFVKVAHHGSKNNTSNELLDMIDCQNYLIPTNGGGAKSYHPDREALANIICHAERDRSKTVHMYFNYKLEVIETRKHFKLFHSDEPENYNFVIHEPDSETERSGYHVTLII
jgi:beta-lactamase superfamily II metal-dependent hydrolase